MLESIYQYTKNKNTFFVIVILIQQTLGLELKKNIAA